MYVDVSITYPIFFLNDVFSIRIGTEKFHFLEHKIAYPLVCSVHHITSLPPSKSREITYY